MRKRTCPCQDSFGTVCGKKMTAAENKRDGMCQTCAEQVWQELTSPTTYIWKHKK